ncbi:bifunctional [glutamate--ammonia ligase]-adenylyl-L-tyrosine phosphorylase/[glutamate--ammonia-ligase] adenylyltransferase [soil metagenome]
MNKLDFLTKDLPDAELARRFYKQLIEKHPAKTKILAKNEGLLSDILTIAAFSPLLATTVLQHPEYLAWLNNQRKSAKVRGKEELLESLARFALTNSQLETNVLLARFRRRELLRIYLQDIRNLDTIAEITEEISNLADAILEFALRFARQELDNRYGIPLEIDGKGRAAQAKFCIVALGKLGSKELNYSSDIDLLFLYSADGTTSGQGSRDAVTNLEYFVKLAEFISKIVGAQTGEGAAYRVDLRLRPNGRVGALAISLKEAVRYYRTTARDWEKQVLIRSRSCAGDAEIFQKFFDSVEVFVFSETETVENALKNVRLSKEKINLEKSSDKGFDVKLGTGGIREIEFIAQALQLAFGGRDKWLRVSHTLKSLARLADRKILTETDLTELSEAYKFLRRLEHRLQMENGLQTHFIPENTEKRTLLAKRLDFAELGDFEKELLFQTQNVCRIFSQIFRSESLAKKNGIHNIEFPISNFQFPIENYSEISNLNSEISQENEPAVKEKSRFKTDKLGTILHSLEKSNPDIKLSEEKLESVEKISEISPHFAERLAANPLLIEDLPNVSDEFEARNYRQILLSAINIDADFARRLAILRKIWSRCLLEIVAFDVFGKLSLEAAKKAQTELAEASIESAIFITKNDLEKRFEIKIENFPFAVLGLGKLGGGSLDYESDLDLVLVFDEFQSQEKLGSRNLEIGTFYGKAVEIFVNSLSSFTREGNLYRVDLRLRPDGKNGATSIGKNAFLDYLKNRSAMWEWLAYVKIRGVGGDFGLAKFAENEARKIIHENAQKLQNSNSEFQSLRDETRRIRERLREQKTRRKNEFDIKFGTGGMLDIYFSLRFLQLRDNLPDADENRSTLFVLRKLFENNLLTAENFANFNEGYVFLSELDHNLRLINGRSTCLPIANQNALQTISQRMRLASVADLLEKLTFHRLNIRSSFEYILKN